MIQPNTSPESTITAYRLAAAGLPARIASGLLQQAKDPVSLLQNPMEYIGCAGLTDRMAERLADRSLTPDERHLKWMVANQVHLLLITEPDYPRNLKEIPDPPPVLFVRGRIDEKDRFSVAVVGSRNASPYGRSVTERIVKDLAAAGLTIVSGGAIGIDAIAHRAALAVEGRTLVVLGCGLNIAYPQSNTDIFQQVVNMDAGALISEFPLDSGPDAWRFPMRNRIISGLSQATLVTEAPQQSGSLITAGIAAEQGREVMAVPGNIDRAGAKGSNLLIKDGATLVETADDVLQVLGIMQLKPAPNSDSASKQRQSSNLPVEQRRILECLSLTPKHMDALAIEARLSGVEVAVELTQLELAGLVRRLPGNTFIRVL